MLPWSEARGFVSAALAEPAAGIEGARPRLVGAARAVLRPVLELRYIAGRVREARRPPVRPRACAVLQGSLAGSGLHQGGCPG